MSNVVDLKLVEIGAGMRLEAEKILEEAKKNAFERVAIIGRLEDGALYVAGTANAGETMILIEQAKHYMAFGKDGCE